MQIIIFHITSWQHPPPPHLSLFRPFFFFTPHSSRWNPNTPPIPSPTFSITIIVSISSFLSHNIPPCLSLYLSLLHHLHHYAVPEWAQGRKCGHHMMPSPSSPSRRSSRLWYGRRKRRMAKYAARRMPARTTRPPTTAPAMTAAASAKGKVSVMYLDSKLDGAHCHLSNRKLSFCQVISKLIK